jgi:hypothetical protein
MLHIILDIQIVTDVNVNIDIGIDIFGTVTLSNFGIQILGFESMTAEEGDEAIDDIAPSADTLDGSGATWSYLLTAGGILFAIADISGRHANPTSIVQEIIVWTLLLASVCMIVAGLILLAEAIANLITDRILAFLTFLGIAIGALKTIDATTATINNIGTTTKTGMQKIFRFFDKRYLQGGQRADNGYQGRRHVGVLISEFIVLGVVIAMAIGFFFGWAYDWFT